MTQCTFVPGVISFLLHSPKRTHEAATSLHQLFVRRTHEAPQVDNPPILQKNVEEAVTEVLAQLVHAGGEQAHMSVEWLQEQVELHLEYSEGYWNR
jgi:hypothetical protein